MTNQTFSILALDGGGIRGLVTAIMLDRLEKKLKQYDSNKPLKDYFDLIAGTSTGSLIACGIGYGLNASQIKELYIDRGEVIFKQSERFIFRISRLFNPISYSRPMFDGTGLEEVLQQELGKMELFQNLEKPTLVTSYDTYNRTPVIFNNTQSSCSTIKTWEVCRASSSAPIAFPGYLLTDPIFLDEEEKKGKKIPIDSEGKKYLPLIDGGVVANNPALFAIAHCLREKPEIQEENIITASFGTGQKISSINGEQVREWGLLEWISPLKGIPLVDTIFDGSADAVNEISKQILSRCQFFRFQPIFEEDFSAFDADPKQLKAMQKATEIAMESQGIEEELDRLVEIMTSTNPASETSNTSNTETASV